MNPSVLPGSPSRQGLSPRCTGENTGAQTQEELPGRGLDPGHLGPRDSGAGGGGVKGFTGGRLGPQAAGRESGVDNGVTLLPQHPSWPPSAQGCSLLPRRGPPPTAGGSPIYSYVVVSVPPGLGRSWKAGGRAGKWLSRPHRPPQGLPGLC